jgi:polygalacturonase
MTDHLSRRQVLLRGLTLAGAAAALPVLSRPASAAGATTASAVAVSAADLPWAQARAIAAETALPSFRNATFNVLSYGAKNDAKTDNTAAFARAITACNAAGGGTVLIPAGTYVTGAIYLKSNVNLRLDGATLMFSGDASKFPTVLTRYESIECMNRSPMIYAYGETNIGLTGNGILDAGNTASWNTGSRRTFLENWIAQGITDPRKRVVPGSGNTLRSAFVEPYRCDRVLIQGITLRTPMFWQLHPTLCTNVTVDGVTTDGNRSHANTDGCDPECCDHVVIKNCYLGSNDDNIAIKSGRDADGRRVNVPSQNIVIFANTMDGTWGAITCGSEQTGGIQNVYAYQNTLRGDTKFGLYIKSNTRRGGFTKNINVDSLTGTMATAFAFVTMTFDRQTGGYLPEFRAITITNSSCTSAPRVFDVSGLSDSHVHGLVVQDCDFKGVGSATDTFSYVDGLRFTNVKINGRPVTR